MKPHLKPRISQKESSVSSINPLHLAYSKPNLKEYHCDQHGKYSSEKTELVVVSEQCYANDGYESVTNSDDIVDLFPKPRKMPTVEHPLVQLHELNELLAFSQEIFTGQQQYLAQAVQELCRSDSEEGETTILPDSLKSMLLFLLKLGNFKKPTSIELNENGTFQLRWKQDDSNLATLRFQKSNRVDYVIFLPSQHEERPIVLNGNMNLFDFEEFFVKRCGFTTKLLRG
jgi:hypothetical protein